MLTLGDAGGCGVYFDVVGELGDVCVGVGGCWYVGDVEYEEDGAETTPLGYSIVQFDFWRLQGVYTEVGVTVGNETVDETGEDRR